MLPKRRFTNPYDTFEYHVHRTLECWDWLGTINKDGYGQVNVRRLGKWTTTTAHRFSYDLHIGMVNDGLHIDHLCKNRRCVNPDHLEAITRQENVNRSTIGHQRRAMTQCKYGHPLSGDNVRLWRGHRICKQCQYRNLVSSRSRRKAMLLK